jgi:hypothetical protein
MASPVQSGRVMLRTEHRREPFTTLNQRRGALLVVAICVLLAAAITFAMMHMDRPPAHNAGPRAVDEVAMLRLERDALEQMRPEPAAQVTLGW